MTWSLPIGLLLGGGVFAVVALGGALFLARRRRVARAFGDPEVLARLLGYDLIRVPRARIALLLAGALALAVALVDPRWGEGEEMFGQQGGPVVLVLDVSSSMLVEDQAPTRLGWTRVAAGAIARELGDVPIGLVVFAGRAYALSPPTRDPGAVELYLDALDTGMITQTGSALSGALRQGVGLLLAGESEGGSMIVISDGNTDEDAGELQSAIDLASRAGVPIVTVGVGTVAGGPVPDFDPVTGVRRGYKIYSDGTPVESRLTETVLQEIARGTGGTYVRAAEATPDEVAELVRSLPGRGSTEGRDGAPRFAWFASLALLLLALEGVAGRSRDG